MRFAPRSDGTRRLDRTGKASRAWTWGSRAPAAAPTMRSGTASACGTTCSATGRAPEWREDRVIADHTTSRALLALQGRRADAWRTHVAGTTGFFAVTIERVCEPVVWTIFRGSGLWGPIQLELFCSD